MAYWWVNQKQTHRLEHADGYLWAPMRDRAGNQNRHWELMEDVAPGDLIFSYVDAAIGKIAVARTGAVSAPRPEGRAFDPWKKDGRRIEVEYADLPEPLTNQRLNDELGEHLCGSGLDRPFNEKGGGKQAYFFELQPRIGRAILELAGLDQRGAEDVLTEFTAPANSSAPTKATTTEGIRQSRRGQSEFRKAVLEAWGGKCAVTGCSLRAAVRASHIKPWSDSDNRERLDTHNGLPLIATLDALFDQGLISFSDDGRIEIHVASEHWQSLGLRADLQIRMSPSPEMRIYLRHHRQHVVQNDS